MMEWTNDHREWYREVYLKSEHWSDLKARKLSESPKCSRCGAMGNLDVHHVNYRHIFNVELSDLMTLCRKCHDEHHEEFGQPRRSRLDYAKAIIPREIRQQIRSQNGINRKSGMGRIVLHLDEGRKRTYGQAAKSMDMTLSEWVISECDEAVYEISEKGKRPIEQWEPPFNSGFLINIETRIERKGAYVWAAKPGKLSVWMIDVLDNAAATEMLKRLIATHTQFEAYSRAAAAAGLSLNDWIYRELDRASDSESDVLAALKSVYDCEELREADDAGPEGEGWQSAERVALWEKVRFAIEKAERHHS